MKGFATREKAMWSHCSQAGLLGANASQKAVPPTPPSSPGPQPSCPFSTEQAPKELRRGRTLPELLAELLVLCLDDSELGSVLCVCPYLTAFLTRAQATYGQVGACYVYHRILTVKKARPGQTGSPRGKRNLHIKAGGDLSLPRQLWWITFLDYRNYF